MLRILTSRHLWPSVSNKVSSLFVAYVSPSSDMVEYCSEKVKKCTKQNEIVFIQYKGSKYNYISQVPMCFPLFLAVLNDFQPSVWAILIAFSLLNSYTMWEIKFQFPSFTCKSHLNPHTYTLLLCSSGFLYLFQPLRTPTF